MTNTKMRVLAIATPVFLIGITVAAGLTAAPAFARSPCTYMSGAERRQCMHDEAVERSRYNKELKDEERDRRLQENGQNRPAQNYGNSYRAAPSYDNSAQIEAGGERERAQAAQRRATVERQKADVEAMIAMHPVSKDETPKVKRDAGPGCVPYSQYASNCMTADQQRALMGLPSEAQEKADALKEQKKAAAEESRQARLRAGPDMKSCIRTETSSRKVYSGQMTGLGPAYETAYDTTITNVCRYSVTAEIIFGGFLGGNDEVTLAANESLKRSNVGVGKVWRAGK